MELIEIEFKKPLKKSLKAHFLNEARELEEWWKQTGLLYGISETDKNRILLEGQRLLNEQ